MEITPQIYCGTVLGMACLIAILAFLLHDEYTARRKLQIEHREAKGKMAALAYLLLENGYHAELKQINDWFGE